MPTICERKPLGKRDKRQDEMFAVDARTCGGEMEDVKVESGIVWGQRCKRCGDEWTLCQGCKKLFRSLAAHLDPERGGGYPACVKPNAQFTRAQASSASAKARLL